MAADCSWGVVAAAEVPLSVFTVRFRTARTRGNDTMKLTVRVRPASSLVLDFPLVFTVRLRPASSCVNDFLIVLTVRLRAARNPLNSKESSPESSTKNQQRIQQRANQSVQQ